MLQLVACSLNWQVLGHPVLPPASACMGCIVSASQAAMHDRLEHLIGFVCASPPLEASTLGRSAEKFEDLLHRAGRLPASEACELLAPLMRDVLFCLDIFGRTTARKGQSDEVSPEAAFAPHSSAAPPGSRPAADFPTVPSGQGGETPSFLPPVGRTSCKPIDASRIKWDYRPSFDPRPHLHPCRI